MVRIIICNQMKRGKNVSIIYILKRSLRAFKITYEKTKQQEQARHQPSRSTMKNIHFQAAEPILVTMATESCHI